MKAIAGTLLLSLSQCCLGEPLRPMAEVRCTKGKVIEVEVEAVKGAAVDDIVTFDTRLYRVDGIVSLPAPTIIMKAGEQCTLKVINKLIGETCEEPKNGYHCSDTTSLHTHGLHVSPWEDNIDTHIEPRKSRRSRPDKHSYTYNVPDYHQQGTHWYHPHHHGSTTLQAMGGMAGVLLVEHADDVTLPEDIRVLYKTAKIPPIMLNHLVFNGTDEYTGFTFLDYPSLIEQYDPVTVPLNPEWGDFSESGKDFYTANGQFNPSVTMFAEDATLFRLVHAGDICHVALQLQQDKGHCEILLLARDGVFHPTPYIKLDSIVLTQGTRADVVIKCDAESIGQTVTVAAVDDAAVMPTLRNIKTQKSIFTINVKRGLFRKKNAMPSSEVAMPEYLQSLMDAKNVKMGGERGVEAFQFTVVSGQFGINSQSFPGWSETRPEVRYLEEFCLEEVYEMTVKGGGTTNFNPDGPVLSEGGFHPFHMHINHFQILDGHDNTGQVIRNGEWRDVVPSWAGIGVQMRMRPMRFTGEVVTHCHLLQHEDSGMMGLYLIKECPAPSSLMGSLGSVVVSSSVVTDSSEGLDAAYIVIIVCGSLAVILFTFTMAYYRCWKNRSHTPLKETVAIPDGETHPVAEGKSTRLSNPGNVQYGATKQVACVA
eukprot:TRINITY_DN17505_c0_g1_i1.p1 TRINITY_DN17505_c0_g1~~TRINITY_DN17505_c0_g1_i1.p1  ORF type:complete len:662 (+),score=143.37 TRINITY_DN17505_c0_g1_i1:37-1986(+)